MWNGPGETSLLRHHVFSNGGQNDIDTIQASLDGIDVVLATITENMVAQQASLTWPIPHAIKEEILAICQGQSLTLSQLGRLDTRLGRLFADAVLALMRQESLKPTAWRQQRHISDPADIEHHTSLNGVGQQRMMKSRHQRRPLPA